MHHIVSDGWSNGVLMRELGTLYQAFQQGLASPLPPLPIQYADYAVWQREWLQGEALEQQVGYWRERLAGMPPMLELPVDHPRSQAGSYSGAAHSFSLNATVSAALERLGHEERQRSS